MKPDNLWPIEADIQEITFGEQEDRASYRVGSNGVTKIEKTGRPGEYCMIPYVRVWMGDNAIAEFGQHKLTGLYYKEPPHDPRRPIEEDKCQTSTQD